MADSIAKAYVQIIPSTKGIKGALGEALGAEMPSAGKQAGGALGASLVSKVKGVLATAGIGAAISKSISAGGDLQQSLGGIETLFKDSADTVIKNAERAYQTAGMSANQYMELTTSFSASLLQGLGGDTQKAAAISDMAMTDMADNANKMGTDMERITDAYQGFAKQNYTMLDNLKLGYGGTKTEMERLLADAQKISGVEYNIDNLSDVYSAIHVIQGELDITGTTAKESAETLSGSAQAMKASFTNVLADLSLGRDLEDSLYALKETTLIFFTDNLLPAIGQILGGLPAVVDMAMTLAVRTLNYFSRNADSIVAIGIDLVTGIGSAIIAAVPYLAESAIRLVSALGTAIVTTDWAQVGADTITGIRNSLDLAAGEILGTDGNIVQSVLDAIQNRLPDVLASGGEMIVNIVGGLQGALPGLMEAAGSLMQQLLETILTILPDMMESGITLIGGLAEGLWNNLPAVISSAANILAELLATIASHLPDLLQKGFELIGQLAAGLIQAIPDAVAAIPQLIQQVKSAFMRFDWIGLGKDMIRGVINGIASMGNALWEAAKNVAYSALNSIKRALGIASPSRVMRDQVGKWIPAGVAIGIEANTQPLTDAMHDLSDVSTGTIQKSLKESKFKPGTLAATTKECGSTVINLYVYGVPGQNVEELADIVMQRMQFEASRKEASM